MTSREKALFEQALIFRQVPAKYYLVKAGDISTELYFIQKGLVRFFYPKDGEEITGFIFKEGMFASSFDSVLTQSPSQQVLETLEDCDLLVIPYAKLDALCQEVPQINTLVRKVLEQRFVNAQRVLASFILDNPEQRYVKFLAQHADLQQRVPQHIIASYLGITPVSLSRIRKRISER